MCGATRGKQRGYQIPAESLITLDLDETGRFLSKPAGYLHIGLLSEHPGKTAQNVIRSLLS